MNVLNLYTRVFFIIKREKKIIVLKDLDTFEVDRFKKN